MIPECRSIPRADTNTVRQCGVSDRPVREEVSQAVPCRPPGPRALIYLWGACGWSVIYLQPVHIGKLLIRAMRSRGARTKRDPKLCARDCTGSHRPLPESILNPSGLLAREIHGASTLCHRKHRGLDGESIAAYYIPDQVNPLMVPKDVYGR